MRSHVSSAGTRTGAPSQGSWKCWSRWEEVLPVGPHQPCACLAVPVAASPAQLLPVVRQNDLNPVPQRQVGFVGWATPPLSRFPGRESRTDLQPPQPAWPSRVLSVLSIICTCWLLAAASRCPLAASPSAPRPPESPKCSSLAQGTFRYCPSPRTPCRS